MGITERVREEFYDRICSEHVLLLCALDVDSLCAVKILQSLFKADNVEHTVVPVDGKASLQQAFTDQADQVKSVVLVNCGGSINLLELLQPEQDSVTFYVVDSRRPYELDNVYSQDQVQLVVREGEELELPAFEEVYNSDMEDESDDEYFSDSEDGPTAKRRKTGDEDSYQTRKRKHLWKKKREEILYKYYEFNTHGTSASLLMYELAMKMSRDSNDLLWWAILGLTEQLLYEKVDRERYVTDLHALQPYVIRHNRTSEDETPSAINSMRIAFDNELRLALYRHWSLYESLCHSEYTACRFKVWTMKGHKKLMEFLADMGLPLVQSKQKFASMEMQHRDTFKESFTESARKYQVEDFTYGSFVAQFGYKNKFCAGDLVYSSTALIEATDTSYSQGFLMALEGLSRTNMTKMQAGIEAAKRQQVAIVTQIRNFVDTHQVVCAGPFVYAYVEEGTPNVKMFSKPHTLAKLARFLREAWITSNKKAKDIPFIVSAPYDVEESTCIITGVPPHSEHTHRSEFAKAFQHAADRIQARATFDHFDGAVFVIKKDDRGKFFDALTALSAF
ncbi:cell division control protein 45 homolog [Halichondria panicea]|uniref:cell division control protein 45 homolog n=1 Tax=Halichondria panicea TaxID=6063 RepID=UPI00312B5CE2